MSDFAGFWSLKLDFGPAVSVWSVFECRAADRQIGSPGPGTILEAYALNPKPYAIIAPKPPKQRIARTAHLCMAPDTLSPDMGSPSRNHYDNTVVVVVAAVVVVVVVHCATPLNLKAQ